MIDFELPTPIERQVQLITMLGEQVMRPISRYYDEHEGERPWDYINMIWQTVRSQGGRTLAAPTADKADGDGEKNLLEYFFNRGPKVAESIPAFSATAAADGSVMLTFPHNRFANDATATYETSPDLSTWTPASPASVSATATNFETEQVAARISRTSTPFFVRVRVTVQ